MKLLEFDQQHPIIGYFITVAGGAWCWLIKNAADITSVAVMIGAVCGAVVAFSGLVVKTINFSTWCAVKFKEWRTERARRRAFERARDEGLI